MENKKVYIAAFAVLVSLLALSIWWLWPKFCDVRSAVDAVVTYAAITCVLAVARDITAAIVKACRR